MKLVKFRTGVLGSCLSTLQLLRESHWTLDYSSELTRSQFTQQLEVNIGQILSVLGPPTFDLSKKQHLIDLCKEISKTQSSDSIKEPNQNTVESRWRTLLANQWPLGTRLPTSTYQGVVIPPHNDDDERALLEIIDVSLYLCQLEGRRVVVTSGGRLGLALQEVLPGDSIFILPGGALPYVLRSQPDSSGWLFLGEW
jgi:hypothetical protein